MTEQTQGMPAADSSQPELSAALDVELVNGAVFVALKIDVAGAEASTVRIGVSPALARYLASRLLGAAAVADPDGHQKILDQISDEFGLSIALGQMRVPPGAVQ